MDYKYAIAILKDNFPDERNALLQEALTTAIYALEENQKLKLKVKGLEKIVDSLLKEHGD